MPEIREFGHDEYAGAIAYLEQLSARGAPRVFIDRWSTAGWVAWMAGPPSLAVYGLARAQEIPERPRIRVGPVERGPTLDVRFPGYPEPSGHFRAAGRQERSSPAGPHAPLAVMGAAGAREGRW